MKYLIISFAIMVIVWISYGVVVWAHQSYMPDPKTEIVRDTVYLQDSFLIPFPVQVPIIEIPHPEHGRMIVNLNDSTIILTASGQVLVEFEDQDMINKYLYQQFDGKNINRKGE